MNKTLDPLLTQWLDAKARLTAKRLLGRKEPNGSEPSVSIRCPGTGKMLFGTISASHGRHIPIAPHNGALDDIAQLHAEIYRLRGDIGAIAHGGGPYGHCLADFSGAIPVLFDEQARHLGRMGPPADKIGELDRALRDGGNALLFNGEPVCLGTTCQRMTLNAELFEKCAKAYVLAAAAGSRMTLLPWLVRRVANGRLHKDQRRASECFAAGRLPPETRGY
ncbi:class II aldolase/adducin family protein [Burkholderia ubonensis]|uniref:class II aldolase/adducin family protein n=1 Tax=Burkholderia ubonensis TaxID=101571 RepID=UPI0009B39BD7|nr:class II aldolase/adducin family protein [Burkholderia ubonensis]